MAIAILFSVISCRTLKRRCIVLPKLAYTLAKSRNKTASATAAAASHHELCMMAMATAIRRTRTRTSIFFACLGYQRH
jgi:hypothetical protein